MIEANCKPVIVMTGMSLFPSAWPKWTAPSDRPRALANFM
jgi:hypothetical protein